MTTKSFLLIFSICLFSFAGISQDFTRILTGPVATDGDANKGGAWIDYDNDGWLDLFVTGTFSNNSLYHNNGDGTFTKITNDPLVNEDFDSKGCTWGDYDNDGFTDVFVANSDNNTPNSLFKNNGDGSFSKITDAGEIVTDQGSTSTCSWVDYDNDGWLDLFITNYNQENALYRNNGDGTFEKILSAGLLTSEVCASNGMIWTDLDFDNDMDVLITCRFGTDNSHLENNGDGTFTKLTNSPASNDGSFSQGFCSGDFDNDGDFDLFLITDNNQLSKLYRNNNGTLDEITQPPLTSDPINSYGCSWGDFNHDGHLDLVVGNASNLQNRLYMNDGNGNFSSITTGDVVDPSLSSEGLCLGDYDNDGDLDVFFASNGSGQVNELYRNENAQGNWLKVNCEGIVSNRSAIGAKLLIQTTENGNPLWQLREISGQSNRYGQNGLFAHFGLGQADIVDSLIIYWPSGLVCRYSDLDVNQTLNYLEVCQEEICDNGIDDDGDGLIDCFDPDCCNECDDFYFNPCPEPCTADSIAGDFDMELQWASVNSSTHEYSVPLVGDINGDGATEIVMRAGPHGPGILLNQGLEIYDGSTGGFEAAINTPFMYYYNGGGAIADIDGNGFAEIIITTSAIGNSSAEAQRIICYEFNGTDYVQKWISPQTYGYSSTQQAWSPAIADFNGDGIPEIYIANQVFNGLDGSLIAEGGALNSFGTSLIGGGAPQQGFSVAVDVLPDDFCANCNGLELVAGNQVYAVNIDGAASVQVEVEISSNGDGQTAIADLDKDGDLDGIISAAGPLVGQVYVYAWDLQTPTLLGASANFISSAQRSISLPNIADFDADGLPEIGIATPNFYRVLELSGSSLTELWGIPTTDESGRTGSTVFDFNSDGENEVVYRTQNNLVIIEGSTGTVLSQIPCSSGTGVEYPVVADVDNDAQAEVICGCGDEVRVYRSGQTPWVSARRVWNQIAYFNVNINDDLTVPLQQQQHHLVGDGIELNNFLTQYADPNVPVPDLTLSLEVFMCSENILYLEGTVCNEGDFASSPNIPIAFYQNDPTTGMAVLIDDLTFSTAVEKDTCRSQVFPLPALYGTPIFAIINDDASLSIPFNPTEDFPVTEILECEFSNNMDSLLIENLPIPLDLGADTTICTGNSLLLEISGGFNSIIWQDGSTDSTLLVDQAGTYWVEVMDDCGLKSDTIVVGFQAADLDLGPDTTLCDTDSLRIEISDYEQYQWSPGGSLNCDTCSIVYAFPQSLTEYILVATSAEGCVVEDTIQVDRSFSIFNQLDTTLCEGESIVFGGVEYFEPISVADTAQTEAGCDSISILNLSFTPADTTVLDTFACEGEFIIYKGVIINEGESALLADTAQGSCAFILVNVASVPNFFITDTIQICPGDSALIFGEFQTEPDIYQRFDTTQFGCDSIHTIHLFVFDEMTMTVEANSACGDDDNGSAEINVTGGQPPFTYSWDDPAGSGPTINGVGEGLYQVTITDSNGCSQIVDVNIGAVSEPGWTYSVKEISCPGGSDGGIVIFPVIGFLYSIDGINFDSTAAFAGLSQGDYEIFIQTPDGCVFSQTATIAEPIDWSIVLPPDTTIELGQSVEIQAQTNVFDASVIEWFPFESLSCPDCLRPTAQPTESTTYTLTVIDSSGCTDTASILINIIVTCNGDKLYIPNIFSPNDDGLNDYFEIVNKEFPIVVNSFRIFGRWGELIYEGTGIDARWDGTFRGNDMLSDVYVYMIEFTCADGRKGMLSGDVTLIR